MDLPSLQKGPSDLVGLKGNPSPGLKELTDPSSLTILSPPLTPVWVVEQDHLTSQTAPVPKGHQ